MTGLFDTDDPTRLWVGLTIGYFLVGIAVTVWLFKHRMEDDFDGPRSTMGLQERAYAMATLLWPLVLVAMLLGWLYRRFAAVAHDAAQQSRDRRRGSAPVVLPGMPNPEAAAARGTQGDDEPAIQRFRDSDSTRPSPPVDADLP